METTCYFLKLPHLKNAKGRPTFTFKYRGKTIIAVADDVESCKIYASQKTINPKHLIAVTLTPDEFGSVRVKQTSFKREGD